MRWYWYGSLDTNIQTTVYKMNSARQCHLISCLHRTWREDTRNLKIYYMRSQGSVADGDGKRGMVQAKGERWQQALPNDARIAKHARDAGKNL